MTGMHLIDYLTQTFLSREQLLARTGIDGARLDALQACGMMPRPSYRLRLAVICDSPGLSGVRGTLPPPPRAAG
jgi:hypothetical protein